MTATPPTNSGADSADAAALSVQEQLDLLLTQIETAEPGTIEPALLPKGFASPRTSATPTPKAPAVDPAQELTQALASFEEALDTEQVDEPATASTARNDSESSMLAALNAALQDLQPSAKAATAKPVSALPAVSAEAPPASCESEQANVPKQRSMEEQLQDEINALLSAPIAASAGKPAQKQAEPEMQRAVDTGVGQEAISASQTQAKPEPSLEDQLANEIQSLLESAPQESSAAKSAQPSIDELDRMLAQEIDEDEELAGDFESVHAITAGIDTRATDRKEQLDLHAATAQEVADELDTQPEDLALARTKKDAQPATKTRRDASAYDDEPATWGDRLALAGELLLRLCFVINWPARRFLSYEWRSNLGYIALIHLFVGVGLWCYLIIYG